MGRYVIPYFEGEDERLGELAGNAAAARVARNVTTDHGRLASAAGLADYIAEAAPGGAESLYVFCETGEDGVRTEYVLTGAADGVRVWRDGQWKLLFTGTAGGWGFLSYKKGGEPGQAVLLADAEPQRLDGRRGHAGDGRRVCGSADV